MPGLDQTGPQGMGPMTGRGWGWCGRGFGRWGRWGRPRTKLQEKKELEAYREELREELEEVEKTLEELGKE